MRFSNGLTVYLSGDTGIKAAKMPVHVPLSGNTMQFDGAARCVAGCQ